jgi:hypothetical protein
MEGLQKVLVLTVFGAMFYTAVAPESQTAKVGQVLFGGFNSWLETITGQGRR